MKIALAQLDYHIGNFLENTTNIVLEIKKAEENNIDLMVFSELSICGYPPLDLLESKDFVPSVRIKLPPPNPATESINVTCWVVLEIGIKIGSITFTHRILRQPLSCFRMIKS